MPTRHAIVIAIDGLRASALGAYGNTWSPTPSLDLLASQSRVFDWLIADSPTLEGFYRAVWRGLAAPLDGVETGAATPELEASIARRLTASGVRAALVSDSEWVAQRADETGFDEVRRLEFAAPTVAAASVADTEMAQLVAIAADQIESWASTAADPTEAGDQPSRLLWIHARGYHGAWDAPSEIRQALVEDDEMPAPKFLSPPRDLAAADPDELLPYRVAYAAQTVVLDECVGVLMAAVAEAGLADDMLVALVGCRGFALGEHGRLGSDVAMLYSEQVHLPLFIRVAADTPLPPPRSFAFVQPQDLLATLLDWFGAPNEKLGAGASSLLRDDDSDGAVTRPRIVSLGQEGEAAVRTAEWMMRLPAKVSELLQNGRPVELYAKPDDRWEANEIADRCVEEAAQMLAALEQHRGDTPIGLG